MDDDLIDTGRPHCPTSLGRLVVAGTLQHPYWECPGCRVAVLAVGPPVTGSSAAGALTY